MKHKFLRAALVLLTSGFCCGAGVTVDLLHGLAGNSVTFKTTLKPQVNQPFLVVSWVVNSNTNIITSTSIDVTGPGYKDRINLDRSTGSLELRNLTEHDSGEYELSVVEDGGLQIHGITKLEVYPKVPTPTMTCPVENFIEGQSSVNLTCNADGRISTREWMRDGQPLLPGDRVSFHENGRVLYISPLDRTDTGVFLCKVSNPVSSETAQCSLVVNYGPDKLTIIQDPAIAEEEERVTLRCFAESLPKATFTWTFNQIQSAGSVYVIRELEENHLGTYTCTARNAVTGLEASKVHVLRGSSAAVSASVSMMVTLTLVGLMLE